MKKIGFNVSQFRLNERWIRSKEDFLNVNEENMFIGLFGKNAYLTLPGISHEVRTIMAYRPPVVTKSERAKKKKVRQQEIWLNELSLEKFLEYQETWQEIWLNGLSLEKFLEYQETWNDGAREVANVKDLLHEMSGLLTILEDAESRYGSLKSTAAMRELIEALQSERLLMPGFSQKK